MTKISYNKWVKRAKEVTGGRLFDSELYFMLYLLWRKAKYQDNDAIIVVAGGEGKGKSTVAIQACATMDWEFNIDRVNLEPEDYIEDLALGKKAQAILYDEAATGLFSREAMRGINTTLTKTLQLIRSKNLILVFCIPNFFLLDKYIREHRIDALILVTSKGEARYYDKDGINLLNEKGSNKMDYNVAKWVFDFKFNKGFPLQIPYEEYHKKKTDNTDYVINQLKEKITKKSIKKVEKKEEDITEKPFVVLSDIHNELRIKYSTLYKHIKENKLKGYKVFQQWQVNREDYNEYKEKMLGGKR